MLVDSPLRRLRLRAAWRCSLGGIARLRHTEHGRVTGHSDCTLLKIPPGDSPMQESRDSVRKPPSCDRPNGRDILAMVKTVGSKSEAAIPIWRAELVPSTTPDSSASKLGRSSPNAG
jgi:hypothetical protein